MKHLPVHGKLSEKMNWHLSRALKMSRHHCGQDSVGPLARTLKKKMVYASFRIFWGARKLAGPSNLDFPERTH